MEDDEQKIQLISGTESPLVDNPRGNKSDSQAILDQNIQGEKKKKYLWWGLGILVFIVALTLILVFALKKKDPNPPSPDNGPHFNPYEVLNYDQSSNTYTLSRLSNLKFSYPFNETYNNKLLNTFKLQGSTPSGDSYRI